MPNKITRNVQRTFAVLAAASRAAHAVETRRAPHAADLDTLQIDRRAFQRINL